MMSRETTVSAGLSLSDVESVEDAASRTRQNLSPVWLQLVNISFFMSGTDRLKDAAD